MATHSAVAGTGSNWRVRLYWMWQAWRLRKTTAPDSSRAVGQFANFAALNRGGHVDAVCDLAEVLWTRAAGPEAMPAGEVRERLLRELGLKSCIALLAPDEGTIGGYAWARVSSAQEALRNYSQIAALALIPEHDWARLESRLSPKPLLVIYDLGLTTRYRRGFSPLKQLFKPLLELGLSHGTKRALWWTPADSPACSLSIAFGASVVLQSQGMVFFQHNDIASIARILSALPAGGISDLIARVAPARKSPDNSRPALASVRQITEREPQASAPRAGSDSEGLMGAAANNNTAAPPQPTPNSTAAFAGLEACNDMDAGEDIVADLFADLAVANGPTRPVALATVTNMANVAKAFVPSLQPRRNRHHHDGITVEYLDDHPDMPIQTVATAAPRERALLHALPDRLAAVISRSVG